MIEPFTTGELRIEPHERPGAVELVWLGKSNARAADRLVGAYLEQGLARARELGVPLEMRFEKLLHFNSSTIASVIRLIEAARAQKTRLILYSDPAREWQRLAFDALRVFIQPDGLFDVRSGGEGHA